jgi:hypothetical protein
MLFWDVMPCDHNREDSIIKYLWCESPNLLNNWGVNKFFKFTIVQEELTVFIFEVVYHALFSR